MKYSNIDSELIGMVCETYELCLPQISYLVRKYLPRALCAGVELSDLRQEALVAFVDALNCYDENKDASLKTFINLCIERRLQKVIVKANSMKNRINNDVLSLDYTYNGVSLGDALVSDDMDLLERFSKEEQDIILEEKIRSMLSMMEVQVFNYFMNGLSYKEIAKVLDKSPKQIDNTIQRIKQKIRGILKGNEYEG